MSELNVNLCDNLLQIQKLLDDVINKPLSKKGYINTDEIDENDTKIETALNLINNLIDKTQHIFHD